METTKHRKPKGRAPLDSGRGTALLLLLLLLSILLSLCFGSASISLRELLSALFGRGEAVHRVILLHVRLPRMLAGLLAGAGLAVSGCLLQSVTDNPLAAPNIIGVNAGAGAAVVLLLAFAPGFSYLSPFFAFLGAFGISLLLLLLCRLLGGRRVTLVLLGMAINALLNALISLLTVLDTDLLSAYHAFSVGGRASVTGDALVLPAILILLSLLLALLLAPRLPILLLGDLRALSLGVSAPRLRLLAVTAAAASAASAVSFAGLLGFVGLAVPHLARRLCGNSPRRLLLSCALLGAALLLLADLSARTLLSPTEIPVGILTALLGAPFFLILLFSGKRGDAT